jgi:hypothetical protein
MHNPPNLKTTFIIFLHTYKNNKIKWQWTMLFVIVTYIAFIVLIRNLKKKKRLWQVVQCYSSLLVVLILKLECRNLRAFGSRLKQGVIRLRAKRKTRKSHHMLLGVRRVWGNEPSHSQMNSHYRSWNPKWTLESSKHDCRGQNPLAWRVPYIIEKLLKRKCLKWAHIAHLDI